jgi:hypothetical protein
MSDFLNHEKLHFELFELYFFPADAWNLFTCDNNGAFELCAVYKRLN